MCWLLMAEMKQNLLVDLWIAKTSSNTGYCQSRDSLVPETKTRTFLITVNSPLLQLPNQPRVDRLKLG